MGGFDLDQEINKKVVSISQHVENGAFASVDSTLKRLGPDETVSYLRSMHLLQLSSAIFSSMKCCHSQQLVAVLLSW